MERNTGERSGDPGMLSQFTKNRFFKGKLMTPQTMRDARSYHRERMHTLNRFVAGSGIVHGLTVDSVKEDSDGIEVTIGAGLAIDGVGRPIVVEQSTTKTLPDVSEDELYLFLQYDEVGVETVPVPDTDGVVEEDAVPNRTVETFELTHREHPPDVSQDVQPLDLDDLTGSDPSDIGRKLARRYHDQHRTGQVIGSEPSVYLGAFERTHDGSWEEVSGGPPRALAYDHDMLFGLLVQHLADADNPHETPVHEPVDPQPDDIDRLNERLDDVEGRIEELNHERETFVTFALRKTIKDRARFFESLSDRIEKRTGAGSRTAREIARLSTDEPVTTEEMEAAYREQLTRVMSHLVELGDSLEGVVPEDSLEQYLMAVSELQSALESDEELLALVNADDHVCETADSLEVLVDVVPDA